MNFEPIVYWIITIVLIVIGFKIAEALYHGKY